MVQKFIQGVCGMTDMVTNDQNLIVLILFKGKARVDMTVEERIGAADRRKMDGNALFKDEKLEEAMQQYEMVTPFLPSDMLFVSVVAIVSSKS